MISTTKIISSEKDSFMRRVLKYLRLGKSDVQTSLEAAPYGVDSNPVKDMIAIYAATGEKGKSYIIGYLNKNQVAKVGELRLFSTDANGVEKTYLWLKNNGNMELGGTAHNLVRYAPLNTALQAEVAKINAELGKIAVAINAIVPGAYTVAPISIDVSASKINEIKTL